ncbi:hypothetical protein SDC9_58713 [bioreactor metagenome]|uniref:Uncharacterized protein n=1 Tax=bioreactor metagenome TaxID=1076179 RepID=A0A644X857_9ZZZZ
MEALVHHVGKIVAKARHQGFDDGHGGADEEEGHAQQAGQEKIEVRYELDAPLDAGDRGPGIDEGESGDDDKLEGDVLGHVEEVLQAAVDLESSKAEGRGEAGDGGEDGENVDGFAQHA